MAVDEEAPAGLLGGLPTPSEAAARESWAEVVSKVSRRDVKAEAKRSCTELLYSEEAGEDETPFTCFMRAAARPGIVVWWGW